MRYSIHISFLLVLISCVSPQKKSPSAIDQFNKLENIFSTANWKMINGTDTSYLYFSRLGDINFTVYDYKMIGGDSSVNEVSYIGYINNAVNWMRSADTLQLVSLDSVSATWNILKGEKMAYSFKKLSDSTISVSLSNNQKMLLEKTLPFATFLVRSKYDFIHHTHMVDSPLIQNKDKKIP